MTDPANPWERLTVGTLRSMLTDLVAGGVISNDTIVCSDSDPEGNGLHPLRVAAAFGQLIPGGGMHPDFEDIDTDATTKPVPAICFGVGY